KWNGETIISYRGTDSAGELLGTDFPIAVNDDYDEAQVLSAGRISGAEISSDRKCVYLKREAP
ncbi:MAG: hypothetical protein ABIU05_15550, partial [Nitrospirales bacterium]